MLLKKTPSSFLPLPSLFTAPSPSLPKEQPPGTITLRPIKEIQTATLLVSAAEYRVADRLPAGGWDEMICLPGPAFFAINTNHRS